jgi:hypothetical protein
MIRQINTDAGSKISRRKFLTAAGASALALPIIKPWLALGQDATAPSCVVAPPAQDPNSPNPWLMRGCNADTVQAYVTAGIPVTGVRHYCAANTVPSVWPSLPATTPPIPFINDVSLCVSIYPLVYTLLDGGYDEQLASFMSTTFPRDMLAPWHEASNVTDGTPGKIDGNGTKITPALAMDMQTYLYNFAKTGSGTTTPTPAQIQNPVYNCAIGAIEIGDWDDASEWMAPGLDFYGMDLYQGNFSDPTVPLEQWREQVYGTSTVAGYSPNATISVCECNCSPANQGDRPCYFYQAANWVWNQSNRGARSFLCFWGGTGGLGGPWVPTDCATIAELANIGSQNYSSPGC